MSIQIIQGVIPRVQVCVPQVVTVPVLDVLGLVLVHVLQLVRLVQGI